MHGGERPKVNASEEELAMVTLEDDSTVEAGRGLDRVHEFSGGKGDLSSSLYWDEYRPMRTIDNFSTFRRKALTPSCYMMAA